MKWNTKITKVEPNHLVTKGYRQEDLIGNIPFSHVVYLLLRNELPSDEHGKMIDAILTACIDHGVTPPTAMASRVVASGGVPLPTAVAAGVLSIGDAHGGAIEKGAKFLQEGIARMNDEGKSVDEIAKTLVSESREQKKRILGFGHRVHTADPRTKRLFKLADELNISADHIALSKAIEKELEIQTGKKLPINVDGAIAAISQTEFKPMRKMFEVDCDYDGPKERDLP